jgi:FAD-dependent oxidoreductase domain-containing protein 1
MPDVLIIGGAATGWATAHHLNQTDPSLSVTVIEQDPTLARSSTMLSESNVRIQFNLDENIAMSKYGMECIEDFGNLLEVDGEKPHAERRKQGNLFLVDEEGKEEALLGIQNQRRFGGNVAWLDMAEIERRFPVAASPALVGGTFGPDDGPVDAHGVVAGYRRRAKAGGVSTVDARVESLVAQDERISGARVDGQLIEAEFVVVAAGAWSPGLLETVGVSVPVEPVMRTVYVIEGSFSRFAPFPSIFLPSGAYVFPELGPAVLMAWSTDDDPVGFDFTPAPRAHFYEMIWPEIAANLPAFDSLEVVRSWAGLYAQNRLDANAIIGEWPTIEGLFFATGFSGHGYQHCHAMGRHLAELITGKDPTIDLSRFGPQRVIDNEPYAESPSRII